MPKGPPGAPGASGPGPAGRGCVGVRCRELGQRGCGLGVGREDDVSFQRTCWNMEWDCRGGRPD